MPRHDAEYVLPLRWQGSKGHGESLAELTAYLTRLSGVLDVTVVDGSPEPLYALHRNAWSDLVRHVRPQPWPGRNGKVAGVVTGVRAARHERVVIADDDVRHDEQSLVVLLGALEANGSAPRADLVRPQNYFDPLPWHARWDTGRTLLNRALGRDHPGTFALRRSRFLSMGGYDGDVLFENLELSRTVRAVGGHERHLPGLFVRRLPPSSRHFFAQRVRQAYDDLAQPTRLAAELATLPCAVAIGHRWGLRGLVVAAVAVVLTAEAGRRRAGGRRVFPPDTAMWALPWLAERSVCVWIALGQRARGGVPYHGTRIARAAHRTAQLRRGRRPALSAYPSLRPG